MKNPARKANEIPLEKIPDEERGKRAEEWGERSEMGETIDRGGQSEDAVTDEVPPDET